jgi:hypothetical protein
MSAHELSLRNLSIHILLNADHVEEQSTNKYTVLHVEPHLYEKFLKLLESITN